MKNSIVKRWVLTVLASTVLIILTVGILSGVLLRKQYYDSVRMALNSRATSLVMSHFNSVSSADNETFNKAAKNFVDNFADKNVMEVWVIDSNGEVVVSSTGFSVDSEPIPDYGYAKTSDNGKGKWIGKMKNGEKILLPRSMNY